MPTATKKEASEYYFPAGEYFPAKLKSVEVVTINYKVKKGPKAGQDASFDKWRWSYEITEGDYAGKSGEVDTEDELTTREDNLVRQFAETLLGREIALGEDFDTDLVLEMPCIIVFRHDEPRLKRDGTNFYPCVVDEVLPVSGSASDEWATPAPPY